MVFNMPFFFSDKFSSALSIATFQLFRRVAAALPGMDSTPEKSKEDSILFFLISNFPCSHRIWQLSFVRLGLLTFWHTVGIGLIGVLQRCG